MERGWRWRKEYTATLKVQHGHVVLMVVHVRFSIFRSISQVALPIWASHAPCVRSLHHPCPNVAVYGAYLYLSSPVYLCVSPLISLSSPSKGCAITSK